MHPYDVVVLTDSRYINPTNQDQYTKNVLLEDGLVLKALEAEGLKVAKKAWDDANFNWSTTKYILFRTTWDYFERFTEFSLWLECVSKQTTLINSKEIIYWNIDKHYLLDLQQKGVNIPPTRFIEKGEKITLGQLFKETGWNTTVLKPCISGGGWNTFKINKEAVKVHEATLAKLLETESMMLQPFQENIVTKGEVSMMVFGGKFTHAILKRAKSGDYRVQDDYGGTIQTYSPSQEEISFAEKAINACFEMPIYARVDIFRDNNNELALAELELIEPELWFREHTEAATLLAKEIKKQLL
jgi:glutathione synthase/RimK-type ligase-like ATP-grasp enzyme